ncbi:MAG TPA: cation:proton antiporter [Nocardioidaceae bacterium]|nr:cation:proton antiporter [Nocardioidaceae bacterium]
MTSDEILYGLALTVALAVGCQILARQLRAPALVVLLPVGFCAGALTDSVHPDQLLGSLFEPLVSLSVAIILFESGLGLDLRKLKGGTRTVVIRLLAFGVPITWVLAGVSAAVFLDMSEAASIMIGAILVVSGPTVVGPLLAHVRPNDTVRHPLIWEGTLIDPIGGIIGALIFHGIVAGGITDDDFHVARFLGSVAIGLAAGAVGAAVLWFLLRTLDLPEVLGTNGMIATVVAVAALSDAVRDDTGLIAAVFMGLVVSNVKGFDVAAQRPFFETVVQLIIGVLFISISASVTPSSVADVLLPTLGLVAVLVFVARPLVAWVSTWRTGLARGERAFIGWMAPRGIVAASTASAFGATLVSEDIPGAEDILPATFLTIVMTVTLYGLTAGPVARALGVLRPSHARPLVVGGDPWAIDMGRALKDAGMDVLMWAGMDDQRDAIRRAGLSVAPGELLAAATGRRAQLEGISQVLLLTAEDDFNALASAVLPGSLAGPVYRVAAPHHSHGVVAPYTGGEVLFDEALTRSALSRLYDEGARIRIVSGERPLPDGESALFVIREDRRLAPVTTHGRPQAEPGDSLVILDNPVARTTTSSTDYGRATG